MKNTLLLLVSLIALMAKGQNPTDSIYTINIDTIVPTPGNKFLNKFINPNKPLVNINENQIGFWIGNGIYGGGDIKHASMSEFSSDISWGAYFQHDFNNYYSIRSNFYRTSIGMHNQFTNLGIFGTGQVPFTTNIDNQRFQPYNSTLPLMFLTDMNILDIEGIWHFGNNVLKDNQKGKLVNSVGLSLGIFHFNPYRLRWVPKDADESNFAWNSRVRREERVNLRELGMEGQNFLKGKNQYSKISTSLGLSWQLSYIFKQWSLKSEVKAVYTSTDYLDDFGNGNWYGGDYEKWLNAAKNNKNLNNDPTLFDNFDQNATTYKFFEVSGGELTHKSLSNRAQRSSNGLNDWYYQIHIGVSYKLDLDNIVLGW